MPFQTRYLFTASMDVEAEQEALFEEIYDTEHIPLLTKVPGIVSVARFKREDLTLIMGGERMTISVEDEPQYSALYEIESPRRPGQCCLGESRGSRTLAERGAALYVESPPHPAAPRLLRVVAASERPPRRTQWFSQPARPLLACHSISSRATCQSA